MLPNETDQILKLMQQYFLLLNGEDISLFKLRHG